MYDVAVIGAGPAGSAAARKAAQLGLRVLLLEKEKIPRMKLCGGGVTPKVLKLLDFALPHELIEAEVFSIRIHVGDECFKFQADHPLVYMTSRDEFDAFLSRKAVEAGAEIRDRTLVRSLVRRPSSMEIHTGGESFEAKMVIGCDGMGGTTARASGLYAHWSPDEVSYAIESEVPVGKDFVREFMGSEGYFDVHFGVSPAGYGWVFPKDDHLTAGVGCRLSKLTDGRGLFRSFVETIPELRGISVPDPQVHLIPLGGVVSVPTVAERVLLAGDSAGFAEPLLGEGIYFAILGGQVAAEVTDEACRTQRFDQKFLTRYSQECDSAFGSDFRAAYRLAKSSYLENYDMKRLASFFFSDRKFQDCMIGLMDGSTRYRDVPAKMAFPYLKYRLAKIGFPA